MTKTKWLILIAGTLLLAGCVLARRTLKKRTDFIDELLTDVKWDI